MFIEVLYRTVGGRSIIWIEEIVGILTVYIGFLGAAWVLKIEGHVKVDLILSRLKPAVQCLVNAVTSIFGVICFLLITYYGILVTVDFYVQGYYRQGLLYIPAWPVLIAIPIGSFIFAIQWVRRINSNFRRWRELATEEAKSKEERERERLKKILEEAM